MAHFPKAPRFPREQPSDVPGPGLYNPKLHDPLDDPWRKGPLEIFKAPRSKPIDPGPDTFGLYNPDGSPKQDRQRPRATSTFASPSKHQTDLLRLESKVFERESEIANLNQLIRKSEQTARETRKVLENSQKDNRMLQEEVEQLRQQISKVAGLQRKLIVLQDEHDKSKSRRDKELVHLKSELSQAEDRASRYSKEKDELKQSLDSIQKSQEHDQLITRTARRAINRHTTDLIHKLITERDENSRSFRTLEQLNRLSEIRRQKTISERTTQVDELVTLLSEANSREECLYDVLDHILETDNMITEDHYENQEFYETQMQHYQTELELLAQQLATEQALFTIKLDEQQRASDTRSQEVDRLKLELQTLEMINKSMSETLKESSDRYGELARECGSNVNQLKQTQIELEGDQQTIERLQGNIKEFKTKIFEVERKIIEEREIDSKKIDELEYKRIELEDLIKDGEGKLKEEKQIKMKLLGELRLSKQAEAACRSELEYQEELKNKIKEIKEENERLQQINDLMNRERGKEREEYEKIIKMNDELISQHNPSQKVKVLDRIRREFKEEKQNVAKLENELWRSKNEIEILKKELKSYQMISNTNKMNKKPIRQQQEEEEEDKEEGGSNNINGILRVRRMNLKQPEVNEEEEVNKLIRRRKKRNDYVNDNDDDDDERIDVIGDLSLGAIKMQGKMTLEELR